MSDVAQNQVHGRTFGIGSIIARYAAFVKNLFVRIERKQEEPEEYEL